MKRVRELLAFNRGVVSPQALARIESPRVSLGAEEQTNFMPSQLGPMSLRPGLQRIGTTYSNDQAVLIPFVFSNTDTAVIELTGGLEFGYLRFWESDALLTRPAVASSVTNGDFVSDLSGWAQSYTGNDTRWSSGLTGFGVAFMQASTSGSPSGIEQTVTNLSPGLEHGLSVSVVRGEAVIRVLDSAGADLVAPTPIREGRHSFAFTPTSNFTVKLYTYKEQAAEIDYAKIELPQYVSLQVPVPAPQLPGIRFTQSGDVVFVTAPGVRPFRIERIRARSWRWVYQHPTRGPMRTENTTQVTLTASSQYPGSEWSTPKTLTASDSTFFIGHVGAIFALRHAGHVESMRNTGPGRFSAPIKVFGAGNTRKITVYIDSSLASAGGVTLTVQRSASTSGPWEDVTSYTRTITDPPLYVEIQDPFDNQDLYYRIGQKVTSPGTGVVGELRYTHGFGWGYCRVTKYLSPTQVEIDILVPFRNSGATAAWMEGSWSAYRGYPAAVALNKGRLWTVGKDKLWGSVVDDYENHDAATVGDAGPINRSVGEGAVNSAQWLVSTGDLIVGTDGDVFRVRATAFDEPITPLNFTLAPITKRGCANVDAAFMDGSVLFVDSSRQRLYMLDPTQYGAYSASDASVLVPEHLRPAVVSLAVQHTPDTRIHCVRSDGKVAVLMLNAAEEGGAWITIETTGLVEQAVVLPGTEEAAVYYLTNINGVRAIQRWAKASECLGASVNKQADDFVHYSGAPTTTIAVHHPNGSSVVCWADGVDQGPLTVSGGTVTLPIAVSNATVGYKYTARFKSTKLTGGEIGLISRKRIAHIGVVLGVTHPKGLRYGPDFTLLDDMPEIEDWEVVAANTVRSSYNHTHLEFNGTYTVDSRLCLEAAAPRPCTTMAVIIETEAP